MRQLKIFFYPFFFGAIVFYLISTIAGVIPSSLRVDLIIVSITISGGILSLWALRSDIKMRIRLTRLAKWFILAGLLLLIFYFFWAWQDLLHVDPNTREFSLEGIGRGIIYWTAAVSFYSSVIILAYAIIELLLLLVDELIVAPVKTVVERLWVKLNVKITQHNTR